MLFYVLRVFCIIKFFYVIFKCLFITLAMINKSKYK